METKKDIFSKYFLSSSSPKTQVSFEEDFIETVQQNSERLTADGNLDIPGFTDAIRNLLDDTWEDGWGVFSDGAPTDTTNTNSMTFPHIIFDVMKRIPSINKKGIKPRMTQLVLDPDNSDYTLILSKRWFDCDCRFLIAHNTNKEAQELMTKFETFMEAYVGYFKKLGVTEIIFVSEDKYEPSESVLSDKSIKCLNYYLLFERIRVERVRTTKALLSQIEAQTQITLG